jgi:hypothetical protein
MPSSDQTIVDPRQSQVKYSVFHRKLNAVLIQDIIDEKTCHNINLF